MGPVVTEPGDKLEWGLTEVDAGETWLVPPRHDPTVPNLWRPGVRLGVRPSSWFHRTECFGPVLGLMWAADLDEAIRIQNGTDFGLGVERIRVLGDIDDEVRRAANIAGVHLTTDPVTPSGRIELLHYLREQSISRTLHRFGNLVNEPPSRA